ncbi:hypothetical protein BGZ61DRAFT_164797 [Ilyonectria robusta]|uniref:uncharacterized protein n=1 Tax=Ilyonectria robusta TaxID=1079257 RepID=UPI001E8E3E61|nr:uncharacterized protein BGZ61DRAFT_164797 [Ilyonectria robusta]KAH8733698.1 hypothetical protein BGZ61DRAFT_164797 [Ilyonectria robusta]
MSYVIGAIGPLRNGRAIDVALEKVRTRLWITRDHEALGLAMRVCAKADGKQVFQSTHCVVRCWKSLCCCSWEKLSSRPHPCRVHVITDGPSRGVHDGTCICKRLFPYCGNFYAAR